MSSTKDFNVAIIGGGMCGLACAVGLSRAGIQVDVFESAPRFEEVGAGVGLGPNAVRALDGLGVLEAVLARSEQAKPNSRAFSFISGYEGHEVVYDYPVSDTDDAGLGIHRAAFLEALVGLVDPSMTHFNKRCTSIWTPSDPQGRYAVHFADGTYHEADIIIGADGIKSTTRSAVIGDKGRKRLVFSNTVAYRGLIPTETLKSVGVKTPLWNRPHNFVGRDRHIISFPIKAATMVNVVAFATNRKVPIGSVELAPGQPWVTPVPQEELLADFEGWGPDVQALLGCMKSPSKWSIHAVDPAIDSFVKGKVVLIGDAAHGMVPHLGAGVGQGFEDVFVLVRLLAHPQTTAANVEDALRAYDYVRPPRANRVLAQSAAAGELYESFDSNGYTPQEMRERLAGLWDWIFHHDLEKDVERGLEMMNSVN